MKRYGEEFELGTELMETISTYMDDDIREKVHFEIAPCAPEEFLKRYMELAPDFQNVLRSEFSIEI